MAQRGRQKGVIPTRRAKSRVRQRPARPVRTAPRRSWGSQNGFKLVFVKDHRRFAADLRAATVPRLRALRPGRAGLGSQTGGQEDGRASRNPPGRQSCPGSRSTSSPALSETTDTRRLITEPARRTSRRPWPSASIAGHPCRSCRRCHRSGRSPTHTITNGGYAGISPRRYLASNVACTVGKAQRPTRRPRTRWATSVSLCFSHAESSEDRPSSLRYTALPGTRVKPAAPICLRRMSETTNRSVSARTSSARSSASEGRPERGRWKNPIW